VPDPLLPPAGGWRGWWSRLDDLSDRLGVPRRRLLSWLAAVAVALGVVAGVVLFGSHRGSPAPLDRPRAGAEPSATPSAAAGAAKAGVTGKAGGGSGPPAPSAVSSSVPPTGPMVVDVAGAVVHPGIYRMPPGSRVADAVAAAGGPTAQADVDQVNLAELVSDGQQVRVPRPGDPPPVVAARASPGGATTVPAPVNLNAATAEQLDTLPRVGPATAAAIIEWRTRHGAFHTVDDLLDVSGIGPARLEQLRPYVRV
jgi:competence protein ComEA